ncbi:unnamed protein product, partial [Staurois parvus]
MCPLQRPRPSPPADAGIRLLCSGPRDVGTYGRAPPAAGNLKNLKKCLFFFFQFSICFVLRPACILSVLS